ncbi:diguanylate cyclase [Candidatus Auribacterota bacterium]
MSNLGEKVLIADKDARLLSREFQAKKYSTIEVSDAEEALKKAYTEIPDLIIGDLDLPQMSRVKFCEAVRKNVLLKNTPIIVLSKEGEALDSMAMAQGGIDDCIQPPVNFEDLFFRIKRILSRTEGALNANPLTKLPGNILIKKEMDQRITNKQPISTCFIDLDNFKAFNDRYGFDRGDKAIKLMGDTIINSVEQMKMMDEVFIGHIGGDDFVFISEIKHSSVICAEIIKQFDSRIIALYDEKDLERGVIVSEDRKGRISNFPIMTVSIAVVNHESKRIIHHAEICERGSELKKYVKSFSGSNFIEDRRKT